ncbi:acetyl-CoA carboxylase biotin carboxyl carrier protein subunit [Micromonospora sp. WMMD1102]|uniref:acetyl-CoA carboxylase biotin carboxyl carrier protein n=1 Tax=Micromonospora sp. WMMD1102 TaxID=3016105 RepID=UPI002414FA68|nr:biotin/lipoyl-containing protein [Micromonospora sp. WMMD1102]MDG4786819.1 acetyl-CoA carboxylase biotin carboxyl carrier protein subunit [Micromonospora sp. WMMD1102]
MSAASIPGQPGPAGQPAKAVGGGKKPAEASGRAEKPAEALSREELAEASGRAEKPAEALSREELAEASDRTEKPAEALGGEMELAELRRQAGRLLAETAGPVRRIHLRRGDTVLEIEWHVPAAPAEPAGAAGPPPAGASGHFSTGAPEHLPAGAVALAGSAGSGGALGGGDARRTVLAPMVGTYYQAAEPGGAPFVEVGDKVEPGQVVGIVEAMKLMNEVVADQGGRVAEVLVRDGEPVEFGQPLVALLPA